MKILTVFFSMKGATVEDGAGFIGSRVDDSQAEISAWAKAQIGE